MIEITEKGLKFSFSERYKKVSLDIRFNRTLRIPDDGSNYPLPPSMGRFPLKHVDDFEENIPEKWIEQGGVIMPMYQSEALWLGFNSEIINGRGATYPFAIKIATGKINAVTGKKWDKGLSKNPQNYLVSKRQKWLDGYYAKKGIIKQFVAMPLGAGYSVEEQVTGKDEFGGIQIEVIPMKRSVFEKKFPKLQPKRYPINDFKKSYYFSENKITNETLQCIKSSSYDMGLSPGGKMEQEIYKDEFNLKDWDLKNSIRCFIHLANSMMWRAITNCEPPSIPFTAREYNRHGYPWFEYYSEGGTPLKASDTLDKLKTVKEMGEIKGDVPLTDNHSVNPKNIIKVIQIN